MELFVEQAPTKDECIRKIRIKYGNNVRINVLRERIVRKGGIGGFFSREEVEVSGIVYNDYMNYAPLRPNPQAVQEPPPPAYPPKKPLNFEEEKRKILEEHGKNSTLTGLLNEVREEVRGIKEKIETAGTVREEQPNLSRIEDLLIKNDFSPGYCRNILARARKECSLEVLEDFSALQDKVVEWIGESIQLYAETGYQTRPRIMVLVGPTGVGKTTTLAKLAVIYGTDLDNRRPLSVRLFTADNYRIGAEYQIETYGEIMGLPVSIVKNYRELKQAIALNSEDVDLILIDTSGRSPRASVELGEMKQLLNACGSQAEYHLVLAATTKSSDIADILQQFEPFGYRSVLITKMDETLRIGNVVSALFEKGKAVSYITEGQDVVPGNIQKAAVVRFLINLEGFVVNRNKINKRFPGSRYEQTEGEGRQ